MEQLILLILQADYFKSRVRPSFFLEFASLQDISVFGQKKRGHCSYKI